MLCNFATSELAGSKIGFCSYGNRFVCGFCLNIESYLLEYELVFWKLVGLGMEDIGLLVLLRRQLMVFKSQIL